MSSSSKGPSMKSSWALLVSELSDWLSSTSWCWERGREDSHVEWVKRWSVSVCVYLFFLWLFNQDCFSGLAENCSTSLPRWSGIVPSGCTTCQSRSTWHLSTLSWWNKHKSSFDVCYSSLEVCTLHRSKLLKEIDKLYLSGIELDGPGVWVATAQPPATTRSHYSPNTKTVHTVPQTVVW